MTGFLYFLPNLRSVSRDDLRIAGIEAIADGDSFVFRACEAGPDGAPGCVVALDRTGAEPGYYPQRQTWIPCNGGRFHLGWEALPGPDDLARREQIGGHKARLADGNDWIVPLARSFPSGTELPQALLLGPDGQLVAEALPRFAEISRQAERVYESFLLGEGELSVEDGWRIAVAALALNYHVSAWELSALRALTTENVRTVLGHLVDLPAIMEAAKAEEQKKKAEDDGSSSDGPPG